MCARCEGVGYACSDVVAAGGAGTLGNSGEGRGAPRGVGAVTAGVEAVAGLERGYLAVAMSYGDKSRGKICNN